MLNEMFDGLADDILFLRWLSRKLDYRQNFFVEAFLKWKTNNFMETRGRNILPLAVRQSVWDSWHEMSSASTLTSRPAKLKVNDRAKVQVGLKFADSVHIIRQHGRRFYESNWDIIDITYREMFKKYSETRSDDFLLSFGTFFALNPFYVRSATDNDLEYCCCKTHLHAHWAIQA